MAKPRIGIIISSVRKNRFGEKPAQWIFELARQRDDIEVELIDLRDFPMPFFEEEASPAMKPPQHPVAQRWMQKVDSFDGYVIVAAEYNRGPTAAIKNALDYAYKEWNRKAIGFVGYGGVGAARAIEQLRLNAIELQMAPIRQGVHITGSDAFGLMKGEKSFADLPHLEQSAKGMLDQLVWWTNALMAARAQG